MDGTIVLQLLVTVGHFQAAVEHHNGTFVLFQLLRHFSAWTDQSFMSGILQNESVPFGYSGGMEADFQPVSRGIHKISEDREWANISRIYFRLSAFKIYQYSHFLSS